MTEPLGYGADLGMVPRQSSVMGGAENAKFFTGDIKAVVSGANEMLKRDPTTRTFGLMFVLTGPASPAHRNLTPEEVNAHHRGFLAELLADPIDLTNPDDTYTARAKAFAYCGEMALVHAQGGQNQAMLIATRPIDLDSPTDDLATVAGDLIAAAVHRAQVAQAIGEALQRRSHSTAHKSQALNGVVVRARALYASPGVITPAPIPIAEMEFEVIVGRAVQAADDTAEGGARYVHPAMFEQEGLRHDADEFADPFAPGVMLMVSARIQHAPSGISLLVPGPGDALRPYNRNNPAATVDELLDLALARASLFCHAAEVAVESSPSDEIIKNRAKSMHATWKSLVTKSPPGVRAGFATSNRETKD